ncbi:MAG TPA: S-adenosyl-methyltransferase [Pricia antarctica]|uniref:S-adenosyl-methyltransferase n=2 Tax=root TaxID=1 RepID=A0A831VQJ2_9FLAO|nr:S-adenosyl-methyltransferase [Pricia antarctica]
MKTGLLNILKGTFLISGDAPKNWLFIIFTSFLATIMIGSSHSADKKVHQIAALNEEVKELRSEFVDVRSDMQQLKLESTVMHIVEVNGLFPSQVPPKQIKVKSQINQNPKSTVIPKSKD